MQSLQHLCESILYAHVGLLTQRVQLVCVVDEAVAQSWTRPQTLQHRVHVAGVAQVFETDSLLLAHKPLSGTDSDM